MLIKSNFHQFIFCFSLGLGLELLKETICMCCPNIIIQLGDTSNLPQARNKMPDLTLQWLLQQPVFTPYRVRFQSEFLFF
jgi:hypothetical protein